MPTGRATSTDQLWCSPHSVDVHRPGTACPPRSHRWWWCSTGTKTRHRASEAEAVEGGRPPAPSPRHERHGGHMATGAKPRLAASQSGSSADRRCPALLPSCSQLVYMLYAPPAGAAKSCRRRVHRVTRDPVTDIGAGVEGVQQIHRTCGHRLGRPPGCPRPIEGDGTIGVLVWGRQRRVGSAATATPPNPNDSAAIQERPQQRDDPSCPPPSWLRLCAPASDRPSQPPVR